VIAAYAVNRLGTWFAVVALSVAVFDHTHSALAVAALLFAGQALPALVVPAVVARVETSRLGSELSRLYLFEAVATGALAILLLHFWLPAVLLLVALDGTAALAASALLRAEVARVAREEAGEEALAQEAERKANAALNAAFSTTFVLGPALGGVVVGAAGASTALAVDVVSFLLGAALLADVHHHVGDGAGDSVGARLRGAWRHINEVPALRGVLLAEFVALAFIESGGPIEVTFVKATIHAGDRGLGLLLTAWGAGSVIGSVIFARLLRWPLAMMLSAGTISIAAAYFGLAAAPSLASACLAGLLGGIGNGLQWPSLISVVQRLTPQDLQARLMGAVESLGALCLAIGLPLGGVLVALSSPRIAFLIVGSGATLATVRFLRLPVGAVPQAQAGSHERGAEMVDPVLGSQDPVGESPMS
jgi:MFS family permease